LKNALVSGELGCKLDSSPAGFFDMELQHWIILLLELTLEHGADESEIFLVNIHRLAWERDPSDLIQESQLLEHSYIVMFILHVKIDRNEYTTETLLRLVSLVTLDIQQRGRKEYLRKMFGPE